jgi:hypothetical protein
MISAKKAAAVVAEVVVEADTDVRVVPRRDGPPEPRPQEVQVGLEGIEVQRLVRNGRVDAKAARVRAAQTAQDRHQFEEEGRARIGSMNSQRSRIPGRASGWC